MSIPIQIPESELIWTFSRSSGPGGQNVNKVSSKALLRWNVLNTVAFGFEAKARLLGKLAPRLTKDYDLLITSQRFRDQIRNQEDCRAKLLSLLRTTLRPATPRKPTRPTKGSQIKRVETKRKQAAKKASRRTVRDD